MMKKIIFLSILLFGLMFLNNSVNAQEKNYLELYDEYLTSVTNYNSSHETYALAKKRYAQFGTQQSEDELIVATKEMLKMRDEVVIKYTRVLQKKLNESKGIDALEMSEFRAELDENIVWYESHKISIDIINSLDGLEVSSKEASDLYTQNQILFFSTLSLIGSGRVSNYLERMDAYVFQTKEKIRKIETVTEGDYKVSEDKLRRINSWITEVERSSLRARESFEKIGTVSDQFDTERVKEKPYTSSSVYSTIVTSLSGVNKNILLSINSMNEVYEEITTKEVIK